MASPASALGLVLAACLPAAEIVQRERIEVGRAWAGHPVDFALVTKGSHQFVAWYDTARRLTVSHRQLPATTWTRTVLPTTVGWDSHNGIALAVDDSGYIHVSGNMHNVALVYFRSTRPWDIGAFTSPGMTGSRESSVTYPVFVPAPDGRLFFQFRDGGSGNGTTLWNVYSPARRQWTRVGSTGLFDGLGQSNAYPTNPLLGPDGMFHVLWMWRETPVANTNHHLSHMRGPDLERWQNLSGTSVPLPATPNTNGVVVDPTGPGNGLINMDFGIGWDGQDRPVATYHRYDQDGASQIFNARWENGAWAVRKTSRWTGFKWNLDLTGSLPHLIAAQPVRVEDGALVQRYVYRDGIRRKWTLSPTDLSILRDTLDAPPDAKAPLFALESSFPGMEVRTLEDGEWTLRWETLPTNQDQARTSYPTSTVLRLYRFTTTPLAVTRAPTPAAPTLHRRARGIVATSTVGAWTWEIATPDGRLLAHSPTLAAGEALLVPPRGVSVVRLRSPAGTHTRILSRP